ncbi:MAG: hypothetical protein J6L05_03580 [Ruminococcus sp.]|nr:hypothetical protein [Ruminococcus sp.]
MNRRNKGIAIELTALLDVILIMLFWVMMNVQDNSDAVKAEAESKTAAVQQELEETQKKLDSIREETDAEIARIWQMAQNADKNAAANQQALYGYEQGMLVTMNIRYESNGELIIYNYNERLGEASLFSEDGIYNGMIAALEKAGLSKDNVILCALVYDGNKTLYKDLKKVREATDRISEVYKSFYCTYINTAR